MQNKFKKMIELIPPKEGQKFKLIHRVITPEEIKLAKLRCMFDVDEYAEVLGLEEGTYLVLYDKEKKQIVMSDTWMEQNTNAQIIEKANGDVLIAGLGIGLILLPIQEKHEVTSITVVEKDSEVIDLVTPHLPLNSKVKIVNADINEWKPEKGTKFDVIYFDIWNNISGDNYPEMKKLHARFKRFLNTSNENYFMNSWRKNDCRKRDRENHQYDDIYNIFEARHEVDKRLKESLLKIEYQEVKV